MEVYRRSSWLLLLFGVYLLATTLPGVQGEVETDGPSESECRPFIEKALKELETGDTGTIGDTEDLPTIEITTDESDHEDGDAADTHDEVPDQGNQREDSDETAEKEDTVEDQEQSQETTGDEQPEDAAKDASDEDERTTNSVDIVDESDESINDATDENNDDNVETEPDQEEPADEGNLENTEEPEDNKSDGDSKEEQTGSDENQQDDAPEYGDGQESEESNKANDSVEEATDNTEETANDDQVQDSKEDSQEKINAESISEVESKNEEPDANAERADTPQQADDGDDDNHSKQEAGDDNDDVPPDTDSPDNEDTDENDDDDDDDDENSAPEEDLTLETEIPDTLRDRDHVEHLLKLDKEASETEHVINRVAEITLRELKKLYENAIKPLEILYKYRDLSNRHFGDSEIFAKPLILFMGPWSGGKSSIINYLLDNEYNETSLRTGAEPSPAYFNIMVHGDDHEVIDGTQLAADFTFSGLQKFGQGLEERLRGVKLPSKLLEKVNIVEIPGILEVRKQVSRVFPFNDACQWFIDRADIIFLVYDPSKLDVGPETEAILDQLKGREHQTRIVLNKADQVKPEELMRVQGALIWNISPLMSSAQPPIMYTVSLWSRPYENWAPVRLLQAQERAFLRDLRGAVDKRIENKIASARRFAVRVRNHAKMVDCYLTTYFNHKSVFGNRKMVADQIIEHPQDYHIYEGLSTLTNISRYDLPDPDVYREFFRLNPLYDFQPLSSTCTYFRGCPINRLDIAIAYDLPELIGKHKRMIETALAEAANNNGPDS